ncbi:hypothetical protein BT93_B2589 [Corymbia citriodora subsp. variegata]|nr:hypothetical protein BT93_B2589 [Corymbia citriodora subsp. variegata]KAF8040401.1 hypothetical protein BT93_B2589 [Corymbia citriodora subsp. variegata]
MKRCSVVSGPSPQRGHDISGFEADSRQSTPIRTGASDGDRFWSPLGLIVSPFLCLALLKLEVERDEVRYKRLASGNIGLAISGLNRRLPQRRTELHE